MSAQVVIPREAVEAAARALAQAIGADFDKLDAIDQHNARETAVAALNEAAPLLVAAELKQVAKRFVSEAEALCDHLDVIEGPVAETYLDEAKRLRARATELRDA